MNTLEEHEADLHDALNHLYDPSHQEPFMKLVSILGLDPQADVMSIQEAIVQMIRNLNPPADIPHSARIWRFYNILLFRYIHRMTQEEAAEQLSISPRHLRREQSLAIRFLALQLLNRRSSPSSIEDLNFRENLSDREGQNFPEWLSQVREEIRVLQQSPGLEFTLVKTAIDAITGLMSPLMEQHRVAVRVTGVQPGLRVRMRPASLRQIFVHTISELMRHMKSGEISVSASQTKDRIRLRISGGPMLVDQPYEDPFLRELLAIHNGSLTQSMENQRLTFEVVLPGDKISVLVVDDNLDLVHFFQRFVQGTPYQIAHLEDGSQVFQIVEQVSPDIIILDVMLPNVDGWELLSHLHAHPTTRSIPIIVCSVVRETELALVLGATKFLPKPVRRQQLIQALEEVSIRLHLN